MLDELGDRALWDSNMSAHVDEPDTTFGDQPARKPRCGPSSSATSATDSKRSIVAGPFFRLPLPHLLGALARARVLESATPARVITTRALPAHPDDLGT